MPKRPLQAASRDDLQIDRWRLTKRQGATTTADVDVTMSRRPSDAVQVSLTGHEPAALSAQDAPT